LEVNKEKYSLVNAGGKAVLHLIIQGNEWSSGENEEFNLLKKTF
jgi:hypothetical protein